MCVAQSGATRMPLLCAGSWDTLPLVGVATINEDHSSNVNSNV